MLYPLVLNPEFLIKIQDDTESREKIKNFLIKYKEFLTDIFILIDDEEKNLQKKYDEIINEGEKYPVSKIVVEEFMKLKKFGKSANIKISKKNSTVSDILEKLEKQDTREVIQFPKFFDDDFIKLKKFQSKIKLVNIDYEEANEIIKSITRFSKKVCLIDPMIPYDITTLNNQNKYNAEISRVKLNTTYSAIPYSIGLKELVKNIYKNSFFKDELEIYIITTLNPGKIFNIKKKLENKLKSKESSEISGILFPKNCCCNDLEAWNNLDKTVIESTKHHTFDLIENFEPKILIKQHWLKDKATLKSNEKKQDLYDRFIFSVDLHACLEVRKGLDIFEKEKKLRRETSYYLRVVLDKNEKHSALEIFMHPEYKAQKIDQIHYKNTHF